MSAVTNQPLPFGQLEREKHIQMVLRELHSHHKPPCATQDSPRTQPRHNPPKRASEEHVLGLNPAKPMENSNVPSRPAGAGVAGLDPDSMSALDTVSQLHITTRPELQGPQCVPRRIFSIASRGSREQLFVAVEESSCLCLQCCGPARSSSLQGFDNQGVPVFYFQRPFRVDACCLGCCLMEIKAYSPQNHLLGIVHQRWSMFTPLLEVCNSEGTPTLRIQGSCCPCRCFSTQEFQVVSMIGEKIGKIWKKWPGFDDECNKDHEYFGMEVPLDMESPMKLLLLSATFLLNHMFFEMS